MHHRQLWPIWHKCGNNRLSAFDTTCQGCLADSLQARPMGWPVSINKHDSNMCATSTSTSSTPKLSQQHCENLYSTGLATAADIQQKSVKSSTLKARRAAVKEVAEWMHNMHDVTGWTMLTVFHPALAAKPCKVKHCRDRAHSSTKQPDRHQIPPGHTDRQPNAQHASQEYAEGICKPCHRTGVTKERSSALDTAGNA